MIATLARYRKLLVYVAGVLAAVLATGLLPADAAMIVNAVLAVLTGLGIHQVSNAAKPAAPK